MVIEASWGALFCLKEIIVEAWKRAPKKLEYSEIGQKRSCWRTATVGARREEGTHGVQCTRSPGRGDFVNAADTSVRRGLHVCPLASLQGSLGSSLQGGLWGDVLRGQKPCWSALGEQ